MDKWEFFALLALIFGCGYDMNRNFRIIGEKLDLIVRNLELLRERK